MAISPLDVEAQQPNVHHGVDISVVPNDVANVKEERHDHNRAKLPIGFRTLSIHVDTKVSAKEGPNQIGASAAVKELASLDWHKISVNEVLQRLGVSQSTGLDTQQANRRLQQNGKNSVTPPRTNWIRKILGWIFGGFGSLLLIGSILCFVSWKPLGNPNQQATNLALAVILLVIVVLQAVFNAWQDFSTNKVMASVKNMVPFDVLTLRDSQRTRVPVKELATGDLVYISLGEKIPADLRFIDVSNDLQLDRSILTGESEPVNARVDMTDDNFLESKNIALQGTHCVSGSGLGVVIQTGDKTVFGRIAKLSAEEKVRLTTLQWELLRFVVVIATFAISLAIVIAILWATWLRRDFPLYINVPTLFVDLVSIMIAFIPEGLPIAVTLSLAKVARTLGKNGIVCKSLSIVETLGSVDVICSDKTGTLTQNAMRAQTVVVFDKLLSVEDHISDTTTSSPDIVANLNQVGAVAAICNSAEFEGGSGNIVGDATDTALLGFANQACFVQDIRSGWQEIFKMNFNSKTKFMLKLSQLSPTAINIAPIAPWDHFTLDSFLLTSKGAPEILLPRCSYILNPTGGPPLPLSSTLLGRVTTLQEEMAQGGLRVLLLARRVISDNPKLSSFDQSSAEFAELVEEYHHDLIIVGLVGIIDPLKPDIKHTVTTCRGAGIRFHVITGDHPITATAIAAQAGIISDVKHIHHLSDLQVHEGSSSIEKYETSSPDEPAKGIVITGSELQELSPTQMDLLCEYEEIVFARTTPEQKLRIVTGFQKKGHIVAVTGDGVNDAPSLKAADCGIAMGRGSDVAREAADMVLLNDFSSIIIALEYGRLVFDNLKKSVIYLLPAGSFSEITPVLSNVVIGIPQFLSNIQIILICVVTDPLPALALCMEKPESGLLQRKPRNVKTDRLADWKLFLHAYFFLGLLESICAYAMTFLYLQKHGVTFSFLVLGFGNWPITDEDKELFYSAQTVFFFTLIIMQWGNLFATRARRQSILKHTPMSNLYLLPACIISLSLGIFFSYVPGIQKVFLSRNIPVQYFFIPLTFGLGLILLDELRKLMVRTYPKGIIAYLAW